MNGLTILCYRVYEQCQYFVTESMNSLTTLLPSLWTVPVLCYRVYEQSYYRYFVTESMNSASTLLPSLWTVLLLWYRVYEQCQYFVTESMNSPTTLLPSLWTVPVLCYRVYEQSYYFVTESMNSPTTLISSLWTVPALCYSYPPLIWLHHLFAVSQIQVTSRLHLSSIHQTVTTDNYCRLFPVRNAAGSANYIDLYCLLSLLSTVWLYIHIHISSKVGILIH